MDTVKKSAMAELFGEHSKAIDYLSDLQFSFANLIFSERLNREMSQADFAKEMGISQGLLSRWESGDSNFTLKLIAEAANKLGVKPSLNFSTVNALESMKKVKVKVVSSDLEKDHQPSPETGDTNNYNNFCFVNLGWYSKNKRGGKNNRVYKSVGVLGGIG